jgi:hypothetical protein
MCEALEAAEPLLLAAQPHAIALFGHAQGGKRMPGHCLHTHMATLPAGELKF